MKFLILFLIVIILKRGDCLITASGKLSKNNAAFNITSAFNESHNEILDQIKEKEVELKKCQEDKENEMRILKSKEDAISQLELQIKNMKNYYSQHRSINMSFNDIGEELQFRNANNTSFISTSTNKVKLKINATPAVLFSTPIYTHQQNFKNYEEALKFLFTPTYFPLSTLTVIFFILTSFSFIYSNLIMSFLLTKLFPFPSTDQLEDLIINDSNIDEYLSYPKVKFYLFIQEFCYFKKKYGDNFSLENCDTILIKNEILDMVNNLYSQNAKNVRMNNQIIEVVNNVKLMIIQTKQFENQLKSVMILNIFRFFSCCFFLLASIFLFNLLLKLDNSMKIIITIGGLLSAVLVLLLVSKCFLQTETEISTNEINTRNKMSNDLLVVDKVILATK